MIYIDLKYQSETSLGYQYILKKKNEGQEGKKVLFQSGYQ
jgi:hypothetical protein